MVDNFNSWDKLTGVHSYVEGTNYANSNKNIELLLEKNTQNIIDPVAVLGVLMKNYIIGDRTLVSGISRVPWMSKIENTKLVDIELPKHATVKLSSEKIAARLIELMTEEALQCITGKSTIGILLSGGMDSRIVAGIIYKLQQEKKYTGNVVAISWGFETSRDVVYAQRIAKQFDWEFVHKPITAETLYDNIILTGKEGAEYSPVHLHAMPAISKMEGIDVILAGSYGDSIGRGEYSGRKITELPPFLRKHLNHYSFLLQSAETEALKILQQDVQAYRNRFPNRTETSYREMEMQMHYMRRQLNSCMHVINKQIPLYQMFTSQSVFGFIWSLDASCRTDDIYEVMLENLPGNLLAIPWARDGKRYNKVQAVQEDNFPKNYHKYGSWLRNENRSFVLEKITNGNLQQLGVFNEKSLDFWIKNWRRDSRERVDRLDEKIAWLASLSIFIENYNIKGIKQYPMSFVDQLNVYKSSVYEKLYYQVVKLKK